MSLNFYIPLFVCLKGSLALYSRQRIEKLPHIYSGMEIHVNLSKLFPWNYW